MVKKVKVKVTQFCPTLCDPYTVHGILQVRTLEWVAIPFFRGSSQPRDRTEASCIAGRFFTNCAIREALTSLDGILKCRDITVPTKVCLVKAMVFLVVIYECESWIIKLSTKELMLLNCDVGEDS